MDKQSFLYTAIRLLTLYVLAIKYGFVYGWWTLRRYLPGGQRESFNAGPLTLWAWCFRRMLEELGATYIKMGQIMSTRPDIFPPWMLAELEKLQDDVPPFDSALIPGEFQLTFGKQPADIFAEFNSKPIACASVAQVHEAKLKSGERVAVKIRRPGMKKRAEYDLAVMRVFAKTISLIPAVAFTSPVESVDEFGKSIRGQLDLRNEARNNKRFTKNFEGNPYVKFPKLYEEYCSENILTMEFIEGFKVEDVTSGNPACTCDRVLLARYGLRAIFQMIYHDGFVHADLHPGNIRFLNGNIAVYLDLGMVAEITDFHRELFVETFMAMGTKDGKKVAQLMADYAPSHKITDYAAFEKEVSDHIDKFYGKPLNEIEVSVVLAGVVNILRKHRVRADAAYTVVNVALLVAEGMGRRLYPEINLQQELMPFLTELFTDMMKRRAAGQKAPQPPAGASVAQACPL